MASELLVEACMWDLVPRPGIKPGPPALGAESLNHCATREVPRSCQVLKAHTCIPWQLVLVFPEVIILAWVHEILLDPGQDDGPLQVSR